MTRDMRFFTLIDKDCSPITTTINLSPNHKQLAFDIAIYRMSRTNAHRYIILSLSDEIDKIALENGAEEKYDLAIENLRTEKNYYPFIFGDETVADFIPYLIPYSPSTCKVTGKSGKEYLFQAFNINDKVRDSADGVYIFTITKPDTRTAQNKESHLFLSFASVRSNNVEAIQTAKSNGAKHFLYYYSSSEPERQRIINDIKESQDYKYQVEHFPEVSNP